MAVVAENRSMADLAKSDALQHLPAVPDHKMLRRIGGGSYGEVWLARNVVGTCRAIKVVFRKRFHFESPYEREFTGIRKFEPISRTHEGLVDILQIGRDDSAGYFYYVMELADDQQAGQKIDPATYAPRTLQHEIENRGRLPLDECLQIGVALAHALGHLHHHGLIHSTRRTGHGPSRSLQLGQGPLRDYHGEGSSRFPRSGERPDGAAGPRAMVADERADSEGLPERGQAALSIGGAIESGPHCPAARPRDAVVSAPDTPRCRRDPGRWRGGHDRSLSQRSKQSVASGHWSCGAVPCATEQPDRRGSRGRVQAALRRQNAQWLAPL